MNSSKPSIQRNALLIGALLLSCLQSAHCIAETTEEIPEQFEAYWTDAPDAYLKFKSCLPSATEETFKQQLLTVPENATRRIGNSNTNIKANYVIAQNDVFICVRLDSNNKAIIPTNFFRNTIYFSAQSAEDRKRLHLDLSKQLSRYGLAHALVIMKNGNAMHIAYLADSDLPNIVHYNGIPLKAGEFDINDFKSVYHIPDSSITTSQYGGLGSGKTLIEGVLAPRPIKDEFFVLKGNHETASFSFANTKWSKQDNATIQFLSDGKLSLSTDKGRAIEGTWKVENEALYFDYGVVHVSAVLDKSGNSLLSEGRTVFPARGSQEADHKEFRWKATWTRAAR